MNENPHPPAQLYTPSRWRTFWNRVRRLFHRTYFNMNQALKDQRHDIMEIARKAFAGCCPYHPYDPPMREIRPGDFRCFKCQDEHLLFQQALGLSGPPEPATDPARMAATRFTVARDHGAGVQTAQLAALPPRVTQVLAQRHEKKREK